MEQVLSLIKKIEQLSSTNHSSISSIEKDLLLQYTRVLYEEILALKAEPTTIENNIIDDTIRVDEVAEVEIEIPESSIFYDENRLEDEIETIEESDDITDWMVEDEEELVLLHEEELTEIEEEKAIQEEYQHFAEIQLPEAEPTFEPQDNLMDEVIEPTEPTQSNIPSSLTDFKVWNKDIRTFIGINDKYNFISELFGNNPEAYDEILNEINLSENKREALQFLENSGITTLYQWKEDGFSEQIFYNVLNQFFASR
jgi:hypothetical protein